ncbi:[acyl-carrier-protein] S-malonyltransferase [Saccharomycopsis crataegensis]|uniref:[acyl-carrier-protein] S-malonyltransferase n=1 Tax=Saccharomycopsis crataegensis TaxID=43959 RepID=A0AAV5QN51_9ASCO|nr:[acyl-carrier-protein] S-malonyltransferase [Saccharomycopsis crataegensis]
MSKALIFPGQGVSKFSFLKRIVAKDHSFSKYLDFVDESLNEKFSARLLDDNDPDLFFHKTSNSQPAIVASSYIIHQYLIKHKGVDVMETADVVCGHSLGEFTTLLFNGGIGFQEVIRLVRQRGKLMEENIERYYKKHRTVDDAFKMVALLIQPKNFQTTLNELHNLHGDVYVANINSQKQIAIVGLNSKIQASLQILRHDKKLRIKTIELPITIPFHSPFIQESQHQLSKYASDLIIPNLQATSSILRRPMVTNYQFVQTQDPQEAIRLIVNNTTQPVDFVGLINHLYHTRNVRHFVGLPPGNITKHVEVMKSAGQWGSEVSVGLEDWE